MGSPTVSNAKPVPMESTDKKSLKTLIKSILFHKKKDKTKIKQELKQNEPAKEIKKENTVAAVLKNFDKLNLDEKKTEKNENLSDKLENFNDELEDFAFKTIKEHRNERIHSNSSADSGFSDKSENSDKNNEKYDELTEKLDKLHLENDDKKNKKNKKKKQSVAVSRGPLKTNPYNYKVAPYPSRDNDPYRQITLNKNTLTGGQVTVNQGLLPTDNLSEIDIACETVQQQSQYHQIDPDAYLADVLEYIHEDTKKIQNEIVDIRTPSPAMAERKMAALYDTERKTHENLLADIEKSTIGQDEILQLLENNNYQVPETNFIDTTEMFQYIQPAITNDYLNYTFPTPPRSENVPSPMSASPGSFYPSNSEYTLSPGRSPIYNSDNEKFTEIPHYEEEKEMSDKKARERTASVSSMTMKQYKDMQKEIVHNFSNKDCCQISRKSCKELFEERMQKLKASERKDLCLNVAKMDLKSAYGVLHHILLALARGSEHEDLQHALFSLICERVLSQNIQLFTGETGLSLLKAAALRCPHKPLLTRYLVQCIRTAIKNNSSLAASKDYVFHEVDALGDTLVIACARAGDSCASSLAEIVRPVAAQPPLFKLRHCNADGYTALHVACSQHSAKSPRLHTVHVLLEHAGFELTEGDVKGRDTALHLAVNSANCDLQLILLMFKHVDRKEWKNLAHCANLSSKTPIDLARLATKSTSRQNYPPEVLEFLKKCR